MTDDELASLAHRTCWKYVHSENIDFRQYTFSKLTLRDFAYKIEKQAFERAIRAIEIQEGWNAGAQCSIGAIRALKDAQSKNTEKK